MYSTCLFCHADLGRNEALEHFPVGRRLAYGAAKGRLWVVCRRCERWNLTPLDERWEAIDEAERLFRGTQLRASTDNIGLARVADGAELVRIGSPLRPEFAAWRYGDQFGRRRRVRLGIAGGVAGCVAAAGALPISLALGAPAVGAALGLAAALTVPVMPYVAGGMVVLYKRRQRRPIAIPGSTPLLVGHDWARRARFVPAAGDADVRLELHGAQRHNREDGFRRSSYETYASFTLTGADAMRAASQILAFVNGAGGSRRTVAGALGLLDVPASLTAASRSTFADLARATQRSEYRARWAGEPIGSLGELRPELRLALEMAAHEEQERRAMDGELAELERAWRTAEEIAAIADDLLLPASMDDQLAQLKGPNTARAGAASSPSSDSGSASNS